MKWLGGRSIETGGKNCDQMWENKTRPNESKSCPNSSHISLYLRKSFFKIAQKSPIFFCFFYKQIWYWELSKIVQFGHTGQGQKCRPTMHKTSEQWHNKLSVWQKCTISKEWSDLFLDTKRSLFQLLKCHAYYITRVQHFFLWESWKVIFDRPTRH